MFENLWKPGDKLFGEEGDEGLTPEQQELLKSLETPNSSAQSKALAAQLRRDWLADKAAITKGHLATATGTITQAKPKIGGRAQFQPMNMQKFAMSPFLSDNPMSLGGASMAPVDRDVLYPESTKGITKRSPWWSLMGGYSA
jgi:hypothetical protein